MNWAGRDLHSELFLPAGTKAILPDSTEGRGWGGLGTQNLAPPTPASHPSCAHRQQLRDSVTPPFQA